MEATNYDQNNAAIEEVGKAQATAMPGNIHWSWGDFLLISIVSVTVFFVGSILASFLPISEALFVTVALLIEAIVLLGSVYWLGLRRTRQNWKALGMVPVSQRWWWIAIGLGLLISFIMGSIVLLIQSLLGQPDVNPQQSLVNPGGISWVSIIGTVLIGGIAVPITEEIFFRGVVYRFLRERWGIWIGVIVSAVIFGVAHLDLSVAIAVSILGIVSALVYEHTRSLWPSIMMHIVNNTFKLTFASLVLIEGANIPLI